MKDRLTSALSRNTADYTDIRYETEDSTGFGFRGKELDSASTGQYAGGFVRACRKGGWGFAGFDSLDDLPRAVEQACESARLAGKSTTDLADVPARADIVHPAKMTCDFRGIGLDVKLKLAREYNQILLSTARAIETTRVFYNESFRTVHVVTSRGGYSMEERPRVSMVVAATARRDSLTQRAHETIASPDDFSTVTRMHDKAQEVAHRAVALLDAPVVEGGKYSVVLNPSLAGVFAHEAFGHLSEADFLYENPKMRDLMHLGRQMGVKQLNIVDDGSMGQTIGSLACDDEGTPTQKTYLIKEGVLSGHLHSLETAAKMGATPTGNARALSRTFQPIVRMTNTYIEPGNASLQDLLAGVDEGLYCCGMFGGQTMMEMFTFSSCYAYRVHKGKVGELVRDVVLTGNVFETLNNIDGFGSDLEIPQEAGGCGKNGQGPLPVTCGAPHLRIRNVVIGGKEKRS